MASTKQLREVHLEKDSLKNTTGGTLLKGTCVQIKAATDDEMEQATAANAAVYGVLVDDVANGAYGQVAVRGRCIAKASAALAVGARVTAGTGGKLAAAAANNSCVGIVRSKGADADNDFFELELTGPGAGAHGA